MNDHTFGWHLLLWDWDKNMLVDVPASSYHFGFFCCRTHSLFSFSSASKSFVIVEFGSLGVECIRCAMASNLGNGNVVWHASQEYSGYKNVSLDEVDIRRKVVLEMRKSMKSWCSLNC